MARYRTSLGRRVGRRPNVAAQVERLCPVCGERKPLSAFQPRRRSRALNIFCNGCAKQPAKVRRALQPNRSPLAEHARAIHKVLVTLGERRISKGRRTKGMSAEDYAIKLRKFPERVAAIVGKSYAVMGDSHQLADDEVIMRIRDLLDELDDTVIERNKNKRLARR